ncbi:hypothetical protein [Siminovitchia sp. 179-K 8D1 HS]|uniref:hypothetical protein n=1 Tax=Siminovitchia sp. 179-K 8D1 HS TaxID=3142385 RepID=UPI0039A335F3
MITVFLAVILTIILHEMGHIISIIIFNSTEGRKLCDFRIQIGIKYIFVSHKKFNKPFKNFIVAISGSVFPILAAVFLTRMFNTQLTSIMLLLAIGNLLFLHPVFPDGKNALHSLKEMER